MFRAFDDFSVFESKKKPVVGTTARTFIPPLVELLSDFLAYLHDEA